MFEIGIKNKKYIILISVILIVVIAIDIFLAFDKKSISEENICLDPVESKKIDKNEEEDKSEDIPTSNISFNDKVYVDIVSSFNMLKKSAVESGNTDLIEFYLEDKSEFEKRVLDDIRNKKFIDYKYIGFKQLIEKNKNIYTFSVYFYSDYKMDKEEAKSIVYKIKLLDRNNVPLILDEREEKKQF